MLGVNKMCFFHNSLLLSLVYRLLYSTSLHVGPTQHYRFSASDRIFILPWWDDFSIPVRTAFRCHSGAISDITPCCAWPRRRRIGAERLNSSCRRSSRLPHSDAVLNLAGAD